MQAVAVQLAQVVRGGGEQQLVFARGEATAGIMAGFLARFSCHARIRCGVPLRAAVAGISAVVAGRQIAGRALPARAAVHAALRVTRGQDGAGCRRLESAFRWLLRIWSSWPDADWPRLAEVRYALGL